ncbi:hypothetical protein J7E97_08215 [Streptomyces sp. ISL-66]|uniref:hypothetical protein n=1 Tax=Streptomyces sp. ISL-66 TaxID=2819186 RepID=UPI001BEC2950|nr:hypothetical protein [Streptomyces sp. ISL-66]MBT2467858.1 hypothetical protein [Streptomyces sp. ISL-66]
MPVSYTEQEIREQAFHLGLIGDRQADVPRNLRSKVIATLVEGNRPSEAPSPREPQLAQAVVIQPGGTVLVDGEPFPWLIARQPMEISLDPEGISTVRLTLMAASVQIVQPEPRPESE